TPSALSLFSSVFELFNESQSDLETFVREIESFDSIKPLRNWLRMNRFNQDFSDSSVITKYILKRGNIFSPEIIQEKVNQLSLNCEQSADLIKELITTTQLINVDL